jgi:hypothetical protein
MKIPSFLTMPLPEPVKFALIQQVIVMTLSAMVLDGGALAQVCFYALAAFWGGLIVLLARHRVALMRVDVLLIRWSYIPLCVGSFFVTYWIWSLRGY